MAFAEEEEGIHIAIVTYFHVVRVITIVISIPLILHAHAVADKKEAMLSFSSIDGIIATDSRIIELKDREEDKNSGFFFLFSASIRDGIYQLLHLNAKIVTFLHSQLMICAYRTTVKA